MLRFSPARWLRGWVAGLLGLCCFAPTLQAEERAATSPQTAALSSAEKRKHLHESLRLVLQSAETYREKRDCFSCHHQALPLMAAAAVLSVKEQAEPAFDKPILAQVEFTRAYFHSRRDKLTAGRGVIGGPYTAGYALAGLHAAKHPADETTAALVSYLREVQKEDGSWRIGSHRPPLEDSHFTATALAVQSLLRWPDPAQDKTNAALRKAQAWLLATEVNSTEDAAFKLLGLYWGEASAAQLRTAADELLTRQHKDGSWSQLPNLSGDPYATGQALFALTTTKQLTPAAAAYRRGADWLWQQRLPDGSWKVTSRSKPFQEYFESGFPHEKDQFIAIAASCYSLLALAPDATAADQ